MKHRTIRPTQSVHGEAPPNRHPSMIKRTPNRLYIEVRKKILKFGSEKAALPGSEMPFGYLRCLYEFFGEVAKDVEEVQEVAAYTKCFWCFQKCFWSFWRLDQKKSQGGVFRGVFYFFKMMYI